MIATSGILTALECTIQIQHAPPLSILKTRKLCYRKDDRAMRAMSRCGDMAIRNYPRWRPIQDGGGRHLVSKMAAAAILYPRWRRPPSCIQDGGGRHLEFIIIENSAIRDPPSPKTPT